MLRSAAFERGEWAVQDEAAGLVVLAALDPQPGETVLDVCAAPGGKTLLAALAMRDTGLVVAADRSAGPRRSSAGFRVFRLFRMAR